MEKLWIMDMKAALLYNLYVYYCLKYTYVYFSKLFYFLMSYSFTLFIILITCFNCLFCT